MRHLTEEEFIDLLMGEIDDPELEAHLRACLECGERMDVLKDGVVATRAVEPKIPDMMLPRISYGDFKRRMMMMRLGWVAAAAVLIFSFLGLRFEMNQNGVSLAFSVLGSQNENVAEARIAELEDRLLEVIEVNAQLTQTQIDQRFDAIHQERDEDFERYAVALGDRINTFETQNAVNIATVREELLNKEREDGVRGTLR